MFKIRRGDTVRVVTGKDKGKTGKVLKLSLDKERVIVEGINIVKKHMRKRRQDQQSGITKIEMPIHISNLMLVCAHCNKPMRVGFTFLKDNTKARICKKCKQVI